MTNLPIPTFLQKPSLIVFLASMVFLAGYYGQLHAQRPPVTTQDCGTTFAASWRPVHGTGSLHIRQLRATSAVGTYKVGDQTRVMNGTISGNQFSGTWSVPVPIDATVQTFVAILIPSERKIKVTFFWGNSQDQSEWLCGARTTASPTHPPTVVTPPTVITPPPVVTPPTVITPPPVEPPPSGDDHDNDGFRTFDSLEPALQKASLVRRGPRLPIVYKANDLSMRVLVKEGWPIILEYGLVADEPALLSIEIADRKPFLVRLTPSPRNQINLHVPPIGSDEILVAKVRIEAAEDTDEFRLYGFGMGEKATAALRRINADLSRFVLAMNNSAPGFTGSNLVSLLTPQTGSSLRINVSLPSSLKVRQNPEENVAFSYTSNSDFSDGRWEWWRVRGLKWQKVWQKGTGGISRNQSRSERWNGIITSLRLVSEGFHALNLVAWQKSGEEHEWVTARTDPALEVIE